MKDVPKGKCIICMCELYSINTAPLSQHDACTRCAAEVKKQLVAQELEIIENMQTWMDMPFTPYWLT